MWKLTTLYLSIAALMILSLQELAHQRRSAVQPPLGHSSKASRQRAPHSPARLSGSQNVTGHSYGAFWEVGGGYSTTLILRNKDTHNAVNANVVLFSGGGAVVQEVPLVVPAGEANRLALADVVKPAGESVEWGGLMLEFPGVLASETLGEVVIESYQTGVIFDLPLVGGYRYDTQHALYAPWWLPDDGADASITLFNVSSQDIMVSPAIVFDDAELSAEPLSLAPQQTTEVSLRSLMSELNAAGSQGSVILRYTGPAHSLVPSMLIADPSTGFSLVPAFNAQRVQPGPGQTAWQFSDVLLSSDSRLGFDPTQSLTAYALLSNPTGAQMPARLVAYWGGSSGSPAQQVELPVAPLAPLETRLVSLSQFAASGLLPKGISMFALSATHSGQPGDLAVTIFSVAQNQNFVFASEGTVHPSTKMDSSYWDISGALVALLTVHNPGPVQIETTATLSYQGPGGPGFYVLPTIVLPPNGTQVLNLKQVILSGVPDASGNVVPAGTTFGTLTLQVSGGNSGGGISGGCTSFDPVRGGYGDGTEPDCEDCDTNDECEACPPDGEGDCVPLCSDPSCCGSDAIVAISGPNAVVIGTVGNQITLAASASPSGGSFSWFIDSGGNEVTLTPGPNSGPSATVTAVSPSTTRGDVTIEVDYVVATSDGGFAAGSDTASITVQKPTFLSLVNGSVSQGPITCTLQSPADPPTGSGWMRVVQWQVMDQLPSPAPIMVAGMKVADTITNGSPNTCVSTPTGGEANTNSSGVFGDEYSVCSNVCVTKGSCQTSANQIYTVNGVKVAAVTVVYSCKSITLNGL
jgi:hypothetical protein